jgi:L,D-peptidoglycan transpeptidase YkuD (ErfK/YbiS/YcfS/YnhG family)
MFPTLRRARTIVALLTMCAVASSQASEPAWSNSRQLVLVTTADWNANQGMLQTFAMTEQGWRAVASAIPITIGRAGAVWGVGLHPEQSGPIKREGDGRSPAGVFRIGSAFGYPSSARTALPYEAMSESDYCIDVSASPLYNRIVDARVVGKQAIEGSTEPMRRDIHANGDPRYKLGFIIEHNSKGGAALGSCIFAHIWKEPGEPTSGCTAMDESSMQSLLAWLQPKQNPIFVLLPQHEYARVQKAWRLPE